MSDNSTALTTTAASVFSGIQAFEDAQRICKPLVSSDVVPPQYQGQKGVPNTLVALEYAGRMGISPLAVMQNLHVIHGRPTWGSPFVIALINSCGRYEILRWQLSGSGDSLACYAVTKEKTTGYELKGPTVTMEMAKREGWATKSGSKWQTMPELMIRYRAAAFWGRLYASDLLFGMQTQEEALDVQPVTVTENSVADLNANIAAKAEPQPEPESDELF